MDMNMDDFREKYDNLCNAIMDYDIHGSYNHENDEIELSRFNNHPVMKQMVDSIYKYFIDSNGKPDKKNITLVHHAIPDINVYADETDDNGNWLRGVFSFAFDGECYVIYFGDE